MSDILRKPYEISVWSEEQHYILYQGQDVTDLSLATTENYIVNDYIKEIKVGVIGSNNMDTPIKVFNPHLVSNVNGSHTLTFDLFSKYTNEAGELVQNPWYAYLAPERKVKLKYDGEWYDFIITQRQDTSEKYGIKVTCTDLFISELSKNGFNIELKTDLYNNQGTAQELATSILAETNWNVAPIGGKTLDNGDIVKSDVIKQYTNEALFIYVVPTNITAHAIEDNTTYTITAGNTIYICYSSLANNENIIQFFWRNDGKYVLTDDGTIMNSLHYEIEAAQLDATTQNCNISTQYRGDKLVRKQLSKYIPSIEKVCGEYRINNSNTKYYVYSETVSSSNANIQQLITNNQNFISTDGWSCAGDSVLSVEDDNKLKIEWAADSSDINENPVINSGLYDNRAWFTNGFITGDQIALRVKSTVNQPFTSVILHLYTVDDTAGEIAYNIPGTYSSVVDNYAIYYFNNLPNISYEALVAFSNMDIEFRGTANTSVTITDIQLFKVLRDANNNLVIPDYTAAQEEVLKTVYYVFTEEAALRATNISQLVYTHIYYDNLGNQYLPVYSEDFAKIRSIEGEKSNCFNLLQEICETFECWVKFYIGHDNLGKVYYHYIETTDATPISGKRYYTLYRAAATGDARFAIATITGDTFPSGTYYEKVYDKYVEILEYISTDNYSGFRRGINLKSTNRTSTSTNIVTKLIVEPNANQHANNGFCSIQRSPMNYYGENTLFNFDYYINQHMVDKTGLYRDLYNTGLTGGIGLLPQLKALNDSSASWIVDEQVYQRLVYTLAARVQSLEAAYTQSVELYNANVQYLTEHGYHTTPPQDDHYVPPEPGVPPAAPATGSVPDEVRNWCIARNTYYRRKNYYQAQYEAAKTQYNTYNTIYQTILSELKKITEKKAGLYREFYSKYNRFIKEGSWISEDYQDHDLYYLDALGVLYNSAFPKVEYNFSVIDVAALPEYKGYTFRIGDKTYVEDTEFFGWGENDMPYRQEVIISQIDQALDNPSQNKITVQNYKDRFDNLFQRITASTQSLQYAEGGYARAAAAITTDGRINSAIMNRALGENAAVITNVADQSVTWDNQGITITSPYATNEIVRLVNGGIVLTNDAGKSWTTGITAEGINAKAITTGVLNTNLIRIYNGTKPSFVWDETGLNAYKLIGNQVVNNAYVRFDGEGLAGYENADNGSAPTFKLTYHSFELNDIRSGGKYVKLSTEMAAEQVPGTQTSKCPVIKAGVNNTANFIVYEDGTIYANNGIFKGKVEADSGYFAGELRAATGTFSGELSAATGTFTGTLKAQDILLGSGDNWTSILDGTKISKEFLDLGKIHIDGDDGYITIASEYDEQDPTTPLGNYITVDENGITLTGTINWANSNLGNYEGHVSREAITVNCNEYGTVATGTFPISITTSASRGTNNLTFINSSNPGTNKYYIAVSSSGCSVTNNNNGTFNVTAMSSDNATITVTFTFEATGRTQAKTITLAKVYRGPGGYLGNIDKSNISIRCDEEGTPYSSSTPVYVKTSATYGTNNLTYVSTSTSATGQYRIATSTSGCSVTAINASGQLTINNITTDTATVTITFYFENSNLTQQRIVTLTKVYKGATGAQGPQGPQGESVEQTISWVFDSTQISGQSMDTPVLNANAINLGGYLYTGKVEGTGNNRTFSRQGCMGYAIGNSGDGSQEYDTEGMALWAYTEDAKEAAQITVSPDLRTNSDVAGYVIVTEKGARLTFGTNQIYVTANGVFAKKGSDPSVNLTELSAYAKFG